MFYEEIPDKALRFGDVVQGFISLTPAIARPILAMDQSIYSVEVRLGLCAILSPCCSIRDGLLSLAPLKRVPRQYLENEYFAIDLTNINRKMEPHQTLPKKRWDALPDHVKQERLREGQTFALMEMFVYAAHDFLPRYEVRVNGKPRSINHYMIDFRDAFKVSCSAIAAPHRSPLDSKLLQLSVTARQELRDKIIFYYSRVPDEELALVG